MIMTNCYDIPQMTNDGKIIHRYTEVESIEIYSPKIIHGYLKEVEIHQKSWRHNGGCLCPRQLLQMPRNHNMFTLKEVHDLERNVDFL